MKIEFMAGNPLIEELVPPPSPSKYSVPDWYKTIKPNRANPNIKACMPFFDAFTQGYVQKTWADLYIKETNEGIQVSSDHSQQMVSWREKNDLPEMPGYHQFQFLWQKQWAPILPNGFSGLVVHPLNRIDLPFYTFSGIIDFDVFMHSPIGNLPFYLKKDFQGTIPAGTPMYQIIPLARHEWTESIKKCDPKLWEEKTLERESTPHFYRKKIWQRRK